MQHNELELTGQKFGKLTAIKRDGYFPNGGDCRLIGWLCKCECGNTKRVRGSSLKSGNTTSCGCDQRCGGEKHYRWKNGKYTTKRGYEILCKTHGYIHRLIAEKALGKKLPSQAVIHHYKDKTQNDKIVICENTAYHFLLHQRTRAYYACGHADWRKCWVCKKYDKPENLYAKASTPVHLKCQNEYRRNLWQERRNETQDKA